MRMTITGPWGMRKAEWLTRQVALELVKTLEPNAVRVVSEAILAAPHEPQGLFNRQVECYHEGRLVLGTAPNRTSEAGPSRHLCTAYFVGDAGLAWKRIYGACCKFSEDVTLSSEDCVLNARDMLHIHDDAGMCMWFLHQISGDFEALAITLYSEAMVELTDKAGT